MISAQEYNLIGEIADRASRLYERKVGIKIMPVYIEAEIGFVHKNIVALRLRELRDADDGNFMHDVAGIHRHLNMETERLDDFRPRFAA
jgi:hypothetical protein